MWVEKSLLINGSGYADYTAGIALTNVMNEKEGNKMINLRQSMCLVRSKNKDIYALVIASHKVCNIHTIIYFYENPDLSCDLKIEYHNNILYGSSRRVQYVNDENIAAQFDELDDETFNDILNTISHSLCLDFTKHETNIACSVKSNEESFKETKDDNDLNKEIIKLTAERDIFKNLYTELLNLTVSKG